jgi:hypothetical protein
MSVNLLLSYAFHRRTDLAAVRRDLVCGRLLIDSGAFSAGSKPVQLDDYAAYLQRWSGYWDHAVTLDVIGDPTASRVNTRRLHTRGLPVMPVFTRNDTLPEFDAMVRDCRYVAVGGLVGLPRRVQLARVAMLQRRAAELGGGVHALGIGSLAIIRASRCYSADASTVTSVFRYGTVVYFTGRDLRQAVMTHRARWVRDRDHMRDHGIDLAPLLARGRMPKPSEGPARDELVQAMTFAYAAADEYLKTITPVPAPTPSEPAGPHLYTAANSTGIAASAVCDRLIHTTGAVLPRIWDRYGRSHRCHVRELAHAAN